ncbi:MAG: PorV/PorQ family protein, partial [bacterium]|nr:PorV/PorQ family protein [bacterium]
KEWHFEETFNTKTDQTIKSIVGSYFGIEDEVQIAGMAARVASLNSKRTKEQVIALKDSITTLVPEDYSLRESMLGYLDSLVASYDQARINWEKFGEIEKEISKGLKEDGLDEGELDKINFAIEKARNRFVPEEITMPYSILFSGEANCIASTKNELLIGTENGLIVYNNKRWRILTTKNGLPANNVTCIHARDDEAYIGTDRGVAAFAGLEATVLADSTILPVGKVVAISGADAGDIWAVIDNDLYHFDGTNWLNSMAYSVGIEDSPESITSKFSMYGSSDEASLYREKIKAVNEKYLELTAVEAPMVETDPAADSMMMTGDGADSTAVDSVAVMSEPVQPEAEVAAKIEFNLDNALQPGNSIRMPYCAAIKGDVRDMFVDRDGRVWIGTEYGIWMFSGSRWVSPGYREITVEDGQSLTDLVDAKKHYGPEDASAYKSVLVAINDLKGEQVSAGQKIRVYRNPAAMPVNRVTGASGSVYFATTGGLLEFDGETWRRVDLKELDRGNVLGIDIKDDELWFANDEKIVIKANGRTEISFMHVNWLPELANDLYYEFLSVVTNKEGLGTFGGNVTFITYGSINRTGESGQALGTFEAFDIAFTGSFGTSLTDKLRGGVSMKIIYSRLADVGAGAEKGSGTSTGFAGDLGLLYEWTPRLNLGLAITNIGPKMSYIDAAQADPLPTNLALGFAYKLLRSDYYQFLITGEMNKMLVGFDSGFDEFKTSEGMILNGGAEFSYANLIALRGGYIFDDEGQVKTVTMGVGLRPIDKLRFDFSYIPSNDEVVLANTLRMSIAFLP